MRRNFCYIMFALPIVCRAQQKQGEPGSTIGVTCFKQVNFRNSTEVGIGLKYVSNRQANRTWIAALDASFTGTNPGATASDAGTVVLDAGIFYRRSVGKPYCNFKPFYYAGGALAFGTSGLHPLFPAGVGVTCRLKSIFIDAAIHYNIPFGKFGRNMLRFGVTISGILTRRLQRNGPRPQILEAPINNDKQGLMAQAEKIGAPSGDHDGDGIVDSLDACPLVAGVRQLNGCPVPDTDGDGVNDDIDSCKTIPGPPDNKGCPLPPVSLQSFLSEQSRKIHFKTGSDVLLPSALPVLDSVAKFLVGYPEIRLAIYGHTDDAGNNRMNQRLSENRARAVYLYLLAKGIPGYRLRFQGFGAKRPLVKNTGFKAKAINRRVELLEEVKK